MGTRGRKSAASLAIASVASDVSRLPEAPSYLTPEQEDIWRLIVASRGGDLIAPEAFPVLVEYCRSVTASNQVAAQLDAFDPGWACDEEGLKRWDKLLAMQDRLAGKIASLAGKLRLTPSSRMQPISAGRNAAKGAKLRPWESDAES